VEQVPDPPGNIDPRENQDYRKEGQKNHGPSKLKTIIENIPQFLKPMDVNLKKPVKTCQDRYRDEIDENQRPHSNARVLFYGKHIGKVEEKDRNESDSRKDDLHPQNGPVGRLAVDHDEFPDVPCGKCQNKTRKKAVSNILRIARKNDQTEGDVQGERQGRGKGQNFHHHLLFPS